MFCPECGQLTTTTSLNCYNCNSCKVHWWYNGEDGSYQTIEEAGKCPSYGEHDD